MRKFYSTLKSVVAAALVGAMALSVSCSYNDTDLRNEMEQIKNDLASLTERVDALEDKLDSEVAGLKELINGKVVVTGVETNGDVTTVTLSDGSSFVIDNSKGAAVAGDDYTIGAKEDGGVYYWAVYVNGNFKEYLLVNGEKVAVFAEESEACELKMEVREDGKLYVSIDGGVNWVSTELPAAQVSGACVFQTVVVNENGSVTFVLADGTSFDVAYAELVEFEAAKSALYVKVNETIAVPFAINDAVSDINVMNTPLGWKAEVVDTRAVGGMDFVLNITGPAKNFLQYAEKSGKVAIHFNTAAGACKVMSVDVELAEITMDVDKAGNITIVNTLVDKYERENWGVVEYIQEFNNFYFAVLNYDDYYAYEGRLNEAYNSNWGEFNIPAAASYIQNFFTNVGENGWENAVYEDGVNEKWTINFTVEEVIAYLDWYNQLTYEGNSFVLCAIPTDVQNAGALLWEEMVAVPFKQLTLKIEENVENRTFQQPYFNVQFRGAQKYFLYPQTKSSLERNVELGYYESVEAFFEEALASYVQYPNWYSFGFEVAADVVESNISLAELLAYTSSNYYFETIPSAEYIMAYFAWEEGKTEYTAADLKYIEFATADLVKADPEMEISCEYNDEHSIYTIAVDVTVPETTAVAYTVWMTEEPADEESLYEYILSDGYSRSGEDFADGYTWYVGSSCSNPETTKYLGVLAIDAAGNYTLKYFELTSKGIVMSDATVTIENVEFQASSATITVGGVEGLEVKNYKYYIISTTGNSYYQKTEEQLQDLAYGSNYLYKSSTENPIVATQTADYKYTFTAGQTYKVAVAVEFADGSYSTPAYGEYVFEAGEDVGGDVEVVTYTEAYTSGSLSDVNIIFKNEAGDKICLNFYGCTTADLGYLPEATYYVTYYGGIYGGGYSYVDLADGSYMNVNDGSAIVSEVDGKYRFEIDLFVGDTNTEYKAIFEGLVTGLILPSEYVAPEPEPEPETSGFTAVRADYDFMFDLYEYNGGDAEYAFWLYDAEGNYLEIIHRFSPFTDWNDQWEGKYVTADGSYSVAMKTIVTQKPNTWNCADGELYFVVEAVSEDGLTYMCQTQLPATEVNYIGEGSVYAPGSEPSEGGDDNQGGDEQPEETVIELQPYDWFCSYTGGSEKELGWYDQDGYSIVIDFLVNPITADTYTLSNGLSGMYCKYRGIGMTKCEVTVTDAGDGQLAFDAKFYAQIEGVFNWYHFTWVGDPTTL